MENATLLAFPGMQIKRFKANQLIIQLIVAFNWNACKNSCTLTHTYIHYINVCVCMEAQRGIQVQRWKAFSYFLASRVNSKVVKLSNGLQDSHKNGYNTI